MTYDPYGRRPRRGPQQEPSQVLTASQIAKIEAAFEELNKKAAHWEEQARQWQTTATESRAVAAEWQGRVRELEHALSEAQTLANEAEENCQRWRSAADEAQVQFSSWETRAEELESEAAKAEQRVNELEEALKAAQEGHNEEADRLQQIETDFLESKQRLERRFAIQAEEQRKTVLRDLLPVLDNLDLALDHIPGGGSGQDLRQGVELTRQSFLKMLARHDVFPLDPLGKAFDPELQEAVGTMPDPTLPPGTVARVEQKGYRIGDELLRPARVLVTPL
ncbi:MAG: nucleotide exchange factor GrpE [Candidatus Promineifilaceae bacterium]|jgi:molecular chaperone GrpE